MLQEKNSLSGKKEDQTFLVFLAKTKEGKYAPIEESSLPYTRVKEEREDVKVYEEEYYFSLS